MILLGAVPDVQPPQPNTADNKLIAMHINEFIRNPMSTGRLLILTPSDPRHVSK
jgi:hypothetical protein